MPVIVLMQIQPVLLISDAPTLLHANFTHSTELPFLFSVAFGQVPPPNAAVVTAREDSPSVRAYDCVTHSVDAFSVLQRCAWIDRDGIIVLNVPHEDLAAAVAAHQTL